MMEWIQGAYNLRLSSSDNKIPWSMVPRFISLTDSPISVFEFGGMILPIVTSLYERGRGRVSAMSTSFEVVGIRGLVRVVELRLGPWQKLVPRGKEIVSERGVFLSLGNFTFLLSTKYMILKLLMKEFECC